jgi:SAM-dependent methyltransferase
MTVSAQGPEPTVDRAAHWDHVYTTKQPTAVSWYEPEPTHSLELIAASGLPANSSIIDVGGGMSMLGARLVELGYSDVSVADISAAALERGQSQAGRAGTNITWIEADVRTQDFERRYGLWHDRAVFHFMLAPQDSDAYLATLHRSLRPGGHLILATFGPDGPEQCSGLPTTRYGAQALSAALGSEYELLSAALDTHQTPSGATQQFLYTHFQRRS